MENDGILKTGNLLPNTHTRSTTTENTLPMATPWVLLLVQNIKSLR